jgi:hypothetical protein
MNDARQIAGKARLGEPGQFGEDQPDQIRLFNADESSVLIAEDVDSNPLSPYASFDNSVGVTDDGRVAFTATLTTGGRGVFLSDGTTTIEIATENDAQISEIEFFRPAVNNDGLVAFRAFDDSGLRAIFVGDGATLTPVIREHDLLDIDLGVARIDQNDSSPVFGGAPDLNEHGDLAFQCALTPEDNNQIEWGSGVFVAVAGGATTPGDINGDGNVDVDDLLILLGDWGESGSDADLDGNGTVDVDDLLILLANWG